MDKEFITKEAIRIDYELSRLKEPNSPSKTHYMAKVSDEFLRAANSEDMDILMRDIKSKDICLSGLKDVKGYYALTNERPTVPSFYNGSFGSKYEVLRQRNEYTLLHREIAHDQYKDPTPFIVAWKFNVYKDGMCDWSQGHYCSNLEKASSLYYEKQSLSKSISDRVYAALEKASNQAITASTVAKEHQNSI